MDRFSVFSAEARPGDEIEIAATRIENNKEATVYLLTPEQYENLIITNSYHPVSDKHKLAPQTPTHRFAVPAAGRWFVVYLRREATATVRHLPAAKR